MARKPKGDRIIGDLRDVSSGDHFRHERNERGRYVWYKRFFRDESLIRCIRDYYLQADKCWDELRDNAPTYPRDVL